MRDHLSVNRSKTKLTKLIERERDFFLVDGRGDFLENGVAIPFQIRDGIEFKVEAD